MTGCALRLKEKKKTAGSGYHTHSGYNESRGSFAKALKKIKVFSKPCVCRLKVVLCVDYFVHSVPSFKAVYSLLGETEQVK